MQHPKTIHWGIIGLGKIAHKFAQDLSHVPNCKLYAVASRDQLKANRFSKSYGAQIAYSNYEALVEDQNVDAVYIATPHAFHNEHSILCLNHKKAVLCEKPFAMSLSEVDEMIATAKANNVLLMEALWTYYLPHYQFALNHLQQATYGQIKKIEADFGFQPEIDMTSRVFKKSLGGGSLLDIGIYPLFAALSTLGEPVQIESKATFFENGVDSSTLMLLSYANGVEAHLKSTLVEQTPSEAIFYCDNGIIKINSRFHEPSSVTVISEGNEDTYEFDYTTNGYNYEADHFNELIRQNKKESDIMTFDFSKKLITMLDTVRQQIGLTY
ncbi:Gfo/Idh/MocA family protein [Psychroserpens algicola]|uniref:Gfo/Idh/MocA family oxidoreductase n=1 Tax=Psychroserpens algicola TaxID=1719034 RepID=A0ABT0HCK2_9FLAO|nr:Gfo/Idh/MocA family oxidoreductase [Psychroserpens algicola]MCK8482088.1 Gfo/Idh/MocA family oxidoreductase [Psychroserpens algicola]